VGSRQWVGNCLYKTKGVEIRESRDKQRKWRRQLQNIINQLKDNWIANLTKSKGYCLYEMSLH
jgi:hypothetical protein